MKSVKVLLAFMAGFCLLMACEKDEDEPSDYPEMITKPFDATAIGNYTYVGPDTFSNPKCTGQLSEWRAIVDGQGTGTPIGDFTVHFDFCGDIQSNYGDCYAYLRVTDGDSMFFSISGQVLPGRLDSHPAFVTSYWQDTMHILGGTGKFGGATGILISDDYNSSEDINSHHHWKGTITVAKDKW